MTKSEKILRDALLMARSRIEDLGMIGIDPSHFKANETTYLPVIDAALKRTEPDRRRSRPTKR